MSGGRRDPSAHRRGQRRGHQRRPASPGGRPRRRGDPGRRRRPSQLHHFGNTDPLALTPAVRTLTAVVAGVGIGVVAALMGVAGGELLIPTIVLLFAVDIKIAGSLSLVVSLPTMLVAFALYSRDNSFKVLGANKT